MNCAGVSHRESAGGHRMMANAYGRIMSGLYSPANVPREQRTVGPDDHYWAVQIAKGGQTHIPER